MNKKLEIGDQVSFWEEGDSEIGFIVEMENLSEGFFCVRWSGRMCNSVHCENDLIAINKHTLNKRINHGRQSTQEN